MSRVAWGRGRGSVPWGLVGMLALVGLGEWAFARVEMDVIHPEHWDWRNSARSARVEGPKADVLCFGDSLLKFGALPSVVEAKVGRPSYNLAVAGGMPPTSYFLFRRALRAGARPSAVVLDAAPHLSRDSPSRPPQLRMWPELLAPGELLDLAWTMRDPGFFARTTAAGLLPTFRAREEVRAAVLAALKGAPVPRRFVAAQFLRNTRVNRGAIAVNAGPEGVTEVNAIIRLLLEDYRVDPVNAAYLDRFVDLAAARKIPVFLVLTPISAGAHRHAERSGLDAAHTAFVRSLQGRHPGLTVLDGRRSGYGPSEYALDPLHLNHRGAKALSDDLGSALARALSGGPSPGWVMLPPYRPRTIPVEDLADSAMAILSRPPAPASVRR